MGTKHKIPYIQFQCKNPSLQTDGQLLYEPRRGAQARRACLRDSAEPNSCENGALGDDKAKHAPQGKRIAA
ncbi:MAG: hypothetical protein FIB08_10025 [Candidatus Methanoperedens sp.]|nr:hypothetical protein [Candidatus Methanoperedens sp.]